MRNLLKTRLFCKRFSDESGFSMSELIVVIGIVAVLVGVAGALMIGTQSNSKDEDARNRLERAHKIAHNDLVANEGVYPSPDAVASNINAYSTDIKAGAINVRASIQGTNVPDNLVGVVRDEWEPTKLVLVTKSDSGKVFVLSADRNSEPIVAEVDPEDMPEEVFDYEGLVLRDNPLAYYRLGETSGSQMKNHPELNKPEYNGTYTTNAEAPVAVDLSGSNMVSNPLLSSTNNKSKTFLTTTRRALVPSAPEFNFLDNDYAIEFWVRNPNSGQAVALLGKGTNYKAKINSSNILEIRNGNDLLVRSAGALAQNQTYYVVFNKTGVGRDQSKLYINGIEASSYTGVPTSPSGSATNTTAFKLASVDSDSGRNVILDEVALYANSLDPSQILEHYNKGNSENNEMQYGTLSVQDAGTSFIQLKVPVSGNPPVGSVSTVLWGKTAGNYTESQTFNPSSGENFVNIGNLVSGTTYYFKARTTYGTASEITSAELSASTTTPQAPGQPDTNITSGPSGPTASSSATFEFSSNTQGVSFDCRLDNGTWNSCASPKTYSGLSQGEHVFEVRANNSGTVDSTPATRVWNVDTVAPDTTLVSAPGAGATISNASPVFEFSSPEAGATFECKINSGSWSACSSPKTFSGLPQGSNTIEIRARDAAGNIDATPVSRTFTVDSVAPETTITSGPANSSTVASTSASFAFSSSEAGSTFQCRLDNESWTSCTSPRNLTSLSQGSHTFDVRATDAAGNVDTTPASRTWIVDTQAPDTTLLYGPSGTVNSKSPVFEFSSPDGTATFECKMDAGAWEACTNPKSYSNLADGSHTFQVRAKDTIGNTDATPASRTWTIDSIPPETTINSGPAAGSATNQNSPNFSFTSSETGSTFECKMDSGDWESCSSPKTYGTLSQGSHTFQVRAIDAAGNMDATPASRTWTIDSVAPTTTITSGPTAGSITSSREATIAWTVNETGTTSECRINSGSWTTCVSPKVYSSANGNLLPEGQIQFQVRATDAAGNVQNPATFKNWTIDFSPPTVNILTHPNPASTSASATFTFNSFDTFTTVSTQCRIDGGAWLACTSPNNYTDLGMGEHTFELRGIDQAGNISSIASYTWIVMAPDNDPPETTITNRPTAAHPNRPIEFESSDPGSTFECYVKIELDGDLIGESGDWATCESPELSLSYEEGLPPGYKITFKVRAIDPSGNIDPTPAQFIYITAGDESDYPDTIILSGPSTEDPSTPFEIISTDPEATFECKLTVNGQPWPSPEATDFQDCDLSSIDEIDWGDEFFEDGHWVFTVRAKNDFGVDPTPAVHEWDKGDVSEEFSLGDVILEETTATTARVKAILHGDSLPENAQFAIAYGTEPGTYDFVEWSSSFDIGENEFNISDLTPGTTYYFIVAVIWGDDGEGNPTAYIFSPEQTFHTADASDETPPETTITAGPAAGSTTGSATANFEFSSSEEGSIFECRLDGGSWESCSSPRNITDLTSGSHTFEVRATDGSGNTDPTPANRTWTVDRTPPDTTITSGPGAGAFVNSTSASFQFSSSEGGSTFECRIDSGSWASCSSPRNLTSLSQGAHTFEVRATDAYGNTDSSPAARTWTVDTVIPTVTINSGPAASSSISSGSASFTYTSNEAGASFECHLARLTAPIESVQGWQSCPSPKSFSGLIDGRYVFQIRAVDQAGNTSTTTSRIWTVDTVAPTVTIDSGPNNNFISGNNTSFTFSSEAGAAFECKLDKISPSVSGTWQSCSSPHNLNSLDDAAYLFSVRASDAAGNVSTTSARLFGVDTVAPETTISSGPTAGSTTNSQSASFAFTSSQTSSTFECRLDGGSWTTCTTPRNLSGLSAGSHTFEVRATDPAGNVDLTPASRTWTVDLTPPETTINSGPAAGSTSNSNSASFGFSSSKAGSTFECRLDGGSWTACTSPRNLTSLSSGAHTFEVRATDPAGNVDSTPATRSWTVDTVAPDTTIDSGPTGTVVSTSAAFTFSASETSTFECRIDSGSWAACTSPKNYASLNEGSHTFEVRATDTAGNVDSTPATRNWTINTGNPDTTIDSGPSGIVASASATFTFSASKVGSTFECRLDSGSWTACTSPRNLTSLGQGSHTFEVRAIDTFGSPDPTPASRNWTVDTVAPTASFTSSNPANESTVNITTASFAFTANETATFECRLDSGSWTACTSPRNLTSLGQGSHTFEVRATDSAGNVGAIISSSWSVDTSAPDTTITAGPTAGSTVASTSASFSFTSSEGGSTFECRIDSGAWETCSSPRNLTSLGQGSHTFEVRARDIAGNIDATPASRTWTIDNSPPDTTITAGPDAGSSVASTSASFSFTATKTATFECRIDSGSWTACTSPRNLTSLGQGSHTFEVRATDSFGNVDSTPASRTWTVDTVAPTVSITSGPTQNSVTSSTSATFAYTSTEGGSTFECRLVEWNDPPWTSCPSPKAYSGLSKSAKIFQVRATDAAGNVSAIASRTWTITDYQTSVSDDGPLAYYKLDDNGDGAVAGDSGPLGLHMFYSTPLNTDWSLLQPSLLPGQTTSLTNKSATSLASSSHIKTTVNNTNAAFDLGTTTASSYTLEAWIKAPPTGTTRGLISRGNNTYNIRINSNNTVELVYPNVASITTSPSVLTPNSIYHIVVVKSETNFKMFINGIKVRDITSSAVTQAKGTSGFLSVGSMNIGNFHTSPFMGSMDEVAIYNKALSDAEVAEHYNLGLGL